MLDGRGRTLCFDVESDGLLLELTRLHCLWCEDVDTGERWSFADQEGHVPLEDGVRFLEQAERTVAHNGIDFDYRAIEKVYPWFKRPPIWDTLIVTKLLWPMDVLWELDMVRVKKGQLPQKYARRYSLESWGFRIGVFKTLYDGGWDAWSPTMHSYCGDDVTANVALWKLCKKKLGWEADVPEGAFVWPAGVLELEMDTQRGCLEQTDVGVGFDRVAAIDLASALSERNAQLNLGFAEVFGSWWEPQDDCTTGHAPVGKRAVKRVDLPEVRLPRYSDKTGKRLAKDYVGPPQEHYSPDAPFVRIKRVEFSATNRQHIAKRLQEVFGWKPLAFGAEGNPTLDEGAVKAIPEGLLPGGLKDRLFESFIINKTLGLVSLGKKAWVEQVGKRGRTKTDSGRMHGGVDTIGAVTGRPIYKEPNVSQTPAVSVKEEKDETGKVTSKTPILGYKGGYGWECRSLFVPREGWELTGSDITGLELGLLGHYLAPLDGGAFAERAGDPAIDLHTENAKLTGLSRSDTKTVTYASLYGAGPLLIGQGVGIKEDDDQEELLADEALRSYLQFMRRKVGASFVEPTREEKLAIAKGSRVAKAFAEGIDGYAALKKDLKRVATERGFIKALDGRKIITPRAHLAFNYLLQGGGAIICKAWLREQHRLLQEKHKLVPRRDYNRVIWSHDENQMEHLPGLGELFKAVSSEAIVNVAKSYGYRGVLRTDTRTGDSWARTH